MDEPKKRRKPGPKPLPEGKKKVTRNIAITPSVWEKACELFRPSVSSVVEGLMSKEIRKLERRRDEPER